MPAKKKTKAKKSRRRSGQGPVVERPRIAPRYFATTSGGALRLRVTGGISSMRNLLDEGVRLYIKNLTDYEAEDFKRFIEKEIIPQLDEQEQSIVKYKAAQFTKESLPKRFAGSDIMNFIDFV